VGGTAAAPYLFAANFNAGTVDVYDANLNLNPAPCNQNNVPEPYSGSSSFSNPAYGQQNARKRASIGGAGNGYVAMFNLGGSLIANLVAQGPLNSFWGMAIAPANFGPLAGALLVGNFTDGKINAFNGRIARHT
jgi:uncharacterized protein (TIGR03118 family)